MAYNYYPNVAPIPYGARNKPKPQPVDITGYTPMSYLNMYGIPATTPHIGVQTTPSTIMLGGNTTAEPVQSTEPATTTAAAKPRSNDPVALTPTTPVNTATVSARPQLTPNVKVNNSFDYNRATPCEIMPNGQCRENTNPNDVFTQGYMANMRKNGGESLGDVMLRGLYYGRTVEQQLGAEQSDNDKLAYANALNSPEAMAEVTRLMKGGMSLDTAKSVVSDNVLQQLGSHRARALYALPKAQQALDAQRNTSLGMSYATGTPDTPLDYLGLGNSGVSMINPTNSSATVGGRTYSNMPQGAMQDVYRMYPSPQGMVDAGRVAEAAAAKVNNDIANEAVKNKAALDRTTLQAENARQIAIINSQARILNATGKGNSPEMMELQRRAKEVDVQMKELELQDAQANVSGSDTGGK